MKRFAIGVALTFALAGSALAGEIPSGGITPPPPPPPPSDGVRAASTTAPGEIPTSGLSYEIADGAIDLIQMLIGVGI